MKKLISVIIILCLIALVGWWRSVSAYSVPVHYLVLSPLEQGIFLGLNVRRQQAGLRPLYLRDDLIAGSRDRADFLVNHHQWSHDGWIAGFKNIGITYGHIGENLARNFSTPNEYVTAWMNSPSHRANIVNNHYNYIGIGQDGSLVVTWFSEK